ncbi:MAG: GAF domain-containing protein [Nitrospirae bacterium]|nr:GAF domain-containing protein [Nitrospirota bacterium]MBI5694167.1 GAF domain-containing protein [Nitrospirota bacterium]
MDQKDGKDGFNHIKNKAEEFLQVFRKGEEFTQEVLKENEKLRFKVVQLEEENRMIRTSGPGNLKPLQDKVAVLEEENRRLMERYREVEMENKDFAEKYIEVEMENNNLANLYVASYQLHSTLDFGEAVKTVLEIIMNLVGAERFAVMLMDEKTNVLTAVATEGIPIEDMPAVPIGEGRIGSVALSGDSFFEEDISSVPGDDLQNPIVCIPLQIKEHVIGVIVIYKLLLQKPSFTDVDYELFSMLAGHAATAIFSSKLYSQSERKLVTIQSFLELMKDKPAGE